MARFSAPTPESVSSDPIVFFRAAEALAALGLASLERTKRALILNSLHFIDTLSAKEDPTRRLYARAYVLALAGWQNEASLPLTAKSARVFAASDAAKGLMAAIEGRFGADVTRKSYQRGDTTVVSRSAIKALLGPQDYTVTQWLKYIRNGRTELVATLTEHEITLDEFQENFPWARPGSAKPNVQPPSEDPPAASGAVEVEPSSTGLAE